MDPAHQDPPVLLELRDVDKVYGRGEAAVRALRGVSLAIASGDFIALMGASGSGKSTCLNILGCLDVPTSGEYLFSGVPVADLDPDQRASLRRNYLGFVFQSFNLLPRTSALENVELPLVYRGIRARERRHRAREALAAVGLEGREHHGPSELSAGQQQRVAIARALVGEPTVLLADEPTGNLDSARSHEVMKILSHLNQERGITVVMVTHETDMAAYADGIRWFHDGFVTSEPPAKAAV